MAEKRTDCHRPGEIIPTDYTYLFSYSAPSSFFGGVNWKAAQDAIHSETLGPSFRKSATNCHICGSHFVNGDIWKHLTGVIIALGHICADKYSMISDRTEWKNQRAIEVLKAETAKKREKAEERIRETLTKYDGLFDALATDNPTVQDISGRFNRHGYMSDAQRNLVFRIYNQEQEKKADTVNHRSVPEGKQTVTGTIVSVKYHENQYGSTAKMTVKVPADGGFFLIWSTVPAHILDSMEAEERNRNEAFVSTFDRLKGREITFTATLSRSDRDRHFGFAKRPSKAKLSLIDSPHDIDDDVRSGKVTEPALTVC